MLLSSSFLFSLFLNYSVVAHATTEPLPPAREVKVKAISVPLPQYKQFLKSGDLLAAQKELVKLLRKTAGTQARHKLEKELYDLHLQILFSKTISPDSVLYKVKKGDSLRSIAKKYKTTVQLIQKINEIQGSIIQPGQQIKVFKGELKIHVDKSDNKLWLFSDGRIFKEYEVATGKGNSTPVGKFTIQTKVENPTWYHKGSVIPHDNPENILGPRWLGLSKPSYGIHGTTIPQSIGTQSSSGCVRMKNNDVEELFLMVPFGTEVEIRD